MSSQEPSGPNTAAEFFNAGAAKYEEATGGCTRELALKILSLPELSGVFAPEAKVLDNACGTGIIAEEIAKRCSDKDIGIPSITCVDAAENMVDITRAKFSGTKYAEKFTLAKMPGEKLAFPDGTFSHSITNLGILFFENGEEGAMEIYRTLSAGGVAVVTSWSDMGHVNAVLRPAREAAKPDAPAYKFPIVEKWLHAENFEEAFEEAGFRSVDVLEEGAHYGAADIEELSRLLRTKVPGLVEGWSEDEKERFGAEVDRLVREKAMPYKMGGKDMVGIPMMGIVAVCTK